MSENGMALAPTTPHGEDEPTLDLTALERVIIQGDLGKLSPDERWNYYVNVCRSVSLNPFTKPFEYITLNNKLTLYALKGATDQLRRLYGLSITDTRTQLQEGLVIVTVTGTDARGRTDSEIGAVVLPPGGEARANALMKALTKAKRRLTLSMCGLGMLDESEVETIPNATRPNLEIVPPAETLEDVPLCADCGNEIKGGRRRDGSTVTAEQAVAMGVERFGRALCAACSRTAAARQAPPEQDDEAL